MADKNFVIDLKIKATSEDAAIEQVRKNLSNLDAQMKKADKSSKDAGLQMRNFGDVLKGMVAGVVSAYGAIRLLADSFKVARENAKDLKTLEQGMIALVGASKSLTAATMAHIEKAEELSGIGKSKIIPGFLQLLEATKNVEQATVLMDIAVGAASRGLGTMEANLDTLTRAIVMGSVRSVDAFAVALRELTQDGVLTSKEIENLHARFGDLGANVNEASIQLDRQAILWQRTKEAMGTALQAVLIPLLPVVKGLAIGFLMLGQGIVNAAKVFTKFLEITSFGLHKFSEEKKLLDDMTDAIENGMETIISMSIETTTAGLAGAKTVTQGMRDIRLGQEKVSEGYKEIKDSAIANIDDAINSMTNLQRAWKEIENLMPKKTRAGVEFAKVDFLGVEEYPDEVKKMFEELNDLRERELDQMDLKDQARKIKLLQNLIAIEKKKNFQTVKMEKELLQAKTAFYLQSSGIIVNSLNAILLSAGKSSKALFRLSQALAVAQAIMNSYEAFTKTLKEPTLPYPANVAMAGVILSMGLAQVAQIAAQKPPHAAKGALISEATYLLAGEAGRELVLPNKYTEMFDRMAERESVVNNYGGANTLVVNALQGAYGIKEAMKAQKKYERLHTIRKVGGH